MKPGPTRIIACAAVLEELRPLLPPAVECLTVESGLHLRPEKLKEELQKLINEVSGQAKHIIVGFGLCSMAVVGLKSEESFLVVPRVDDCIAMCLGSQEAYRNQLRKEPGTYFLSRGWIEAGISLVDEFEEMEKRYGKERTEKIKKAMLKHYTRLAFIHTG
ncbi:MAG: DUF1638 domain-containing protein, partial [Desulfobacterales bacterium]|nr:DUF1638 domain-containing protein [Desulfobacterales bacterium]